MLKTRSETSKWLESKVQLLNNILCLPILVLKYSLVSGKHNKETVMFIILPVRLLTINVVVYVMVVFTTMCVGVHIIYLQFKISVTIFLS